MGQKVSDEFTVPVCRGHHRELHRSGDEAAWWDRQGIDPTPAARALWLESHPLPGIDSGAAVALDHAPSQQMSSEPIAFQGRLIPPSRNHDLSCDQLTLVFGQRRAAWPLHPTSREAKSLVGGSRSAHEFKSVGTGNWWRH